MNKKAVQKKPMVKVEKPTLCNLQCVLMPNGEVICNGQTIGQYDDLMLYLKKAKTIN
jgi:hypothetical protein